MAALPTSPRNISRPRRPVRSLPAEVARKIAAGEVIDRPNAILRELLDNAVDSGADQIQVEIEGGGIDRIRVVDNGMGMTREDLENCARPHATSKITAETDLLNLSTLGFRGEALSSIAAVSRLQITSATQDDTGIQGAAAASSWRLTASVTQEHQIVPANLSQGTIVQSEALFENFPARRTFLKRPAAETLMCRQTFIEKALPRTDISFRLMIDGKQRLDLPKGQSLAQRFTEALGLKDAPELFYEIHGGQQGSGAPPQWKFTIIIGEPAVSRNDKKLIYIYVNGRKINEYSLMQAIDYGATGYFPNGTHPVAALFLEVNPALVDFNIHPAKREARFKDLAPIHRGISQSVRNFFRNYSVSKLSAQATDYLLQEDAMPAGSHPHTERSIYDEGPLEISGKSWWQQAKANHHGGQRQEDEFDFGTSTYGTPQQQDSQQGQVAPRDTGTNLRYQFFNDCYSQAAIPTPHYETKTEGRPEQALQEAYYGAQQESASPAAQAEAAIGQSAQTPPRQPTNLPQLRYLGTTQGVYLVVELGESLYLIDQHAAHERLLYNRFIAQAGQRQNLLVPYVVETSSDADDEYLRSLTDRLEAAGFETKECGEGRWEFSSVPLQWQGTEADLEHDLLAKRIIPEELVASLASTNACRHAVMDGTVLDEATATQLAKDTLALEDPHCPHGRPLWLKISREDMDQGVKRT